MNTQNIIEYIRRGVGLRFTRRRTKLTVIACAPVILVALYIGILDGEIMQGFGLFATVTYLLSLILVYILLGKGSAEKQKLLAAPCGYYDLILVFSLIALLLAKKLCISIKLLAFSSIPALAVPLVLMLVHSVLFRSFKNMYRKRISVVLVPISCGITGIGALMRLIFHFVYDKYKNQLTQDQIGFILLCGCVLVIYLLSSAFLDIQRYYYFTKLETKGVVTEDILKN